MKIIYLVNNISGSGGLERVLSVKTKYLINKLNYQVHIITLNQKQNSLFYDFSNKIKYHNINIEGNTIKYFYLYKKTIQQILKTINPDVITVCDDGIKGLLFPIIFGKGIPVVYERHASINLNFSKNKNTFINKIKSSIERKLMVLGAKRFDSFVVLTQGNKEDWPNVNCMVIPNPSPFPPYNDIVTREKVVLAVGGQGYNKGYHQLITIWKTVNKSFPKWTLKVYGTKNEKLKLQEKVNDFGLEKSVFFKDPIKNIEDQYKKASIFVMSSKSEGFGMVLIEAMNYGVPCISFDCPHGPADIIKNGEDGFLIENGNKESFANAIINLIEDKEKREILGNNAKENVKQYSPESIMKIWDTLYKNLVNR